MNNILKFSEDGKTVIGVNDKNITNITIPDGVTAFGRHPFAGCNALESIDIPSSVVDIPEWGLNNGTALRSINVSVNNPNYASLDGVLYDKKLKTIIRFPSNKSITEYNIPNSVTKIKHSAFYGCKTLKSINIPCSVTTIGNIAFCGCKALQSINVAENNKQYASVDGILFNKDLTSILRFPIRKDLKVYEIPNSITNIGNYAFNECTALQSINIPNSVTNIGNYTFNECTALQSINIPNSVTNIGNCAFFRCEALQSIDIPNSITSIGEWAFRECRALQSIHMRITDIEDYQIDEFAFDRIDTEKCVLYIPEGTELAYRNHPAFGKFKNIEIEKQD